LIDLFEFENLFKSISPIKDSLIILDSKWKGVSRHSEEVMGWTIWAVTSRSGKIFYLFQNAQTGSWTRPASHSMGSKVPSPAIKRQAREIEFQPVPWL
jgi:hypothetical protein